MGASSAARRTSGAWILRLVLLAAGVAVGVGMSTGTAQADSHLLSDVTKHVTSTVSSATKGLSGHHASASYKASPAKKAANPVRRTVSRVTAPVQRTVRTVAPAQRTYRSTAPSKRVVQAPVKRVTHRAPAKKVVRLQLKPLATVVQAGLVDHVAKTTLKPTMAEIAPTLKVPALAVPALKVPALKSVVEPVVENVVAPTVAKVVSPIVAAVPSVLATLPDPVLPVRPMPHSGPVTTDRAPAPLTAVTGPARSGTAASTSTSSPTPTSTAAGAILASVRSTVAEDLGQLAPVASPAVLGSLAAGVVAVAAGVAASGTATTGGSSGISALALIESGLLGAAAARNARVRGVLRRRPSAFVKHPGFSPD